MPGARYLSRLDRSKLRKSLRSEVAHDHATIANFNAFSPKLLLVKLLSPRYQTSIGSDDPPPWVPCSVTAEDAADRSSGARVASLSCDFAVRQYLTRLGAIDDDQNGDRKVARTRVVHRE